MKIQLGRLRSQKTDRAGILPTQLLELLKRS